MFERRLFLGHPVDSYYEKLLSEVNPKLISLFIQSEGEYLHQALYQDRRYLGRFFSSPCNVSDIDLLQSHVYSLLKRLVPNFPYEEKPLWLFPVINVTTPPKTEEATGGRN